MLAVPLVFLAVFLGLAVALLPAFVVVAGVFLPIFLVLAVRFPGAGIVLLLAVVFGVIPAQFVPTIPLAGGRFQANDLMLAVLLFVILVKEYPSRRETYSLLQPMNSALCLLFVLVVVSLLCAILYFQTPIKHVLAETRVFAYWFLLPMIVAVCRNVGSRRVVVGGVLVIAYILSGALVFQHLTGIDVLGAGRVEQLVTVDQTMDVVRATTPGIYLVCFTLLYFVGQALSKQRSWTAALLFSIPLLMGILVTFGRGIWIATALALAILASSFGRGAFIRFSLIGVVGGALFMAALFVVKPGTAGAIVERVVSVREEVEHGSSLEWRYVENEYAMEHLMSNPFVGVGMGGFAHPKFHPMMTDDLLRYVHNGYFYLMLKLGVLGIFFPIFVVIKCVGWYVESYKSGDGVLQKALLTAIFVPVLTSVTQPEWMTHYGVSSIALFLALMLVARSSKSRPQCR